MKKIYVILFAVFCCNFALIAAPYGLLINGTTKLEIIKSFDKVLSLNLIQENELSDRHEYIMSKIEERKIYPEGKRQNGT